jgi:branched-chain amino acid transport system ATP-binding protein
MNLLEVKNLTKKFGGLLANSDVSFNVKPGEIVGIVGPNGAGKTTLFNSINGFYKLNGGKVIFGGEDISKRRPNEICRLGMGRTFQIPQSLNNMTVFENVMVGSLCRDKNISSARKDTKEILNFVSLEKYSNMKVGSLNVIAKKRLEIARALATKPQLLLLDESMAGLRETERIEAVNLIRAINNRGIAILTIEHVMDVVMTVSHKVVVLVSGRKLAEGTPEEVTSNEEVINAYLGGTKHVGS